MKKNNFKLYSILLLSVVVSLSSCTTEDLDPTLAQNKSVEGSITKVDNLYGILKGALNRMTSSAYWGREMIALNEVRSDNIFSNGNSGRYTTQGAFNYNENSGGIWGSCYGVIASANIIINTDPTTLEGDQAYANHLIGAAHFIRAIAHYDLLRVYGQQHAGGSLGVPIVTEFKGEDLFPSRNSVNEVKDAILADLNTAYNLMDRNFDNKVFVSKMAAPALASRVAVYFGDWATAKTNAEIVINSGAYSIIASDAFVSSWAGTKNVNSIMELAYSQTDNLGGNSIAYIYRTQANGSGYGDLEAMPEIADLYEASDVRAGILGYQGASLRNMNKYPDINGWDNIPILRYEEVVLNYAEALLETGSASAALVQLNSITSARGASAYASASKDNIMLERRKELMFEGHRWDDLMRTGSDIVYHGTLMNVLGTLTYPNKLFAYPIPASELNANSNKVQNDGY